jgi:periplasmic glucans biosynthesis protein
MTLARLFGILVLGSTLVSGTPLWADDTPGLVEPAPSEGAPGAFTFAAVVRRAQELAATDYQPDRPVLPDYLADLDYDAYRDIRFDRDESLWKAEGLPFQMQLFPRGFLFKERVTVNVVEEGVSQVVPFQHDLFDYGQNSVPEEMPADLGFAGLRLLYPINRDDVFDEVVVFLGASYFRGVSKGLNYGITARGLAIDTGLPTQEEFPVFREFWVFKPALRRRRHHGVRPARQRERHRRLQLRDSSGPRNGDGRQGASVHAPVGPEARDRASDEHVLPR